MSEKDIVRDVLDRLMQHEPCITEEVALRVEREVRAHWGGEEVRIAKTVDRKVGRPSVSQAVASEIFKDWLIGNESTSEVTRKHRISRATLYRLMKKGLPEVG